MSTESVVSSSTISATATTGGCHLLKITGYSQSKMLGQGVAVRSSEFEAGGYRWCILYYPRSTINADSIFLALKLTTKDVSRPVNAQLRLTLIPHHGKPPAPAAATYAINGRKTFKCTEDHWGYPFITRQELESSEYLVDDCFSVRFDVQVVKTLAVADQVVQARDLERMGLACSCDDELCKRRHASGCRGLENASVSRSTTPILGRIRAAWLRLFKRKQ